MKTAISVPDATFQRVETRAAELGMNRSEFFATAAEHYLAELDRASLTTRINEALEREGASGRSEDREIARLSTRLLEQHESENGW